MRWTGRIVILVTVFLAGVTVGRLVLVSSTPPASLPESGQADTATPIGRAPAPGRDESPGSDRAAGPQTRPGEHPTGDVPLQSSEDFAADIGLDPEYVNTLQAQGGGLTPNLIMTSEGRIRYGLNNEQVRNVNLKMREFIERIQDHDAQAVTLASRSDDEVVLKIPAFSSPNNMRQELQEMLVSIAGDEAGARMFQDNVSTLSRTLMGFGEHRRVITISNLTEPRVRIQDQQHDATGSPYTGATSSRLNELPVEYRHFLNLQVE